MPVAISYRRFSKLTQGEGDSESRQGDNFEQALRDLREYKLTPGEIFFDRGKSGYYGKNREGELGKILAMVKAALFPKDGWLIVEAFDRLTRQGVDETTQLIRQIILGGVTIYIRGES